MNPTPTIRAMQESDLPRVLTIERQCHGYPWPEEIFREELANPRSRLIVLELDQELAGFLCWWTIAGEIEIQDVATALRFRRQGVGRQLLEYVLAAARAEGVSRALLEARVGNVAAIALYRAYGFIDCGLRRCYYPDGEDALLMEKIFDPPLSPL